MTRSEAARPRDDALIGLVPAAGSATRLPSTPCSKEIYPIGFRARADGSDLRSKAVCEYLLEALYLGGVGRVLVVIRSGKWDIPAYLGDGNELGLDLAYLVVDESSGVPFTVDQAYPFLGEELVLFGFPDILFEPADAFIHLVGRQRQTDADIVLGLFPAHDSEKYDMVSVDEAGAATAIVIKPTETDLPHAWIIAVWTRAFTEFLHERQALSVVRPSSDPAIQTESEVHIGQVIDAAIRAGLKVQTVEFPEGRYLDVGTPQDLAYAVRGWEPAVPQVASRTRLQKGAS